MGNAFSVEKLNTCSWKQAREATLLNEHLCLSTNHMTDTNEGTHGTNTSCMSCALSCTFTSQFHSYYWLRERCIMGMQGAVLVFSVCVRVCECVFVYVCVMAYVHTWMQTRKTYSTHQCQKKLFSFLLLSIHSSVPVGEAPVKCKHMQTEDSALNIRKHLLYIVA